MYAIYYIIAMTPRLLDFEFSNPFEYFFMLFIVIPMFLVLAYFIYVAVKIWQTLSYNNLCKLSGVISLILTLLLFSKIEQLKSAYFQYDRSIWSNIENPILMIIAGIFYLVFKRQLLQWFAVEEEFDYEKHKSGTKLYFGFLVFFICIAISSTADLLPRAPDSQYSAENGSLEALLLWGSIPVAYLIYRISIKLFLKKPPQTPKLAEKAMANFKD